MRQARNQNNAFIKQINRRIVRKNQLTFTAMNQRLFRLKDLTLKRMECVKIVYCYSIVSYNFKKLFHRDDLTKSSKSNKTGIDLAG